MPSRAERHAALRFALRSIGANLRRWRIRRNLTQERLAHLADLDLRYFQRVERGERSVSLACLVGLALILGVSPGMLLRRAALPPATRGRPPARGKRKRLKA